MQKFNLRHVFKWRLLVGFLGIISLIILGIHFVRTLKECDKLMSIPSIPMFNNMSMYEQYHLSKQYNIWLSLTGGRNTVNLASEKYSSEQGPNVISEFYSEYGNCTYSSAVNRHNCTGQLDFNTTYSVYIDMMANNTSLIEIEYRWLGCPTNPLVN